MSAGPLAPDELRRLDAYAAAVPDADVSAPGTAVRALVIEAREDLEMARQVRACLGF